MDKFSTTPKASDSASCESRRKSKVNSPKVRSACNPCHSQKLRCVIQLGEASCERCRRLHKSCLFGQRAPRASLQSSGSRAQGDHHMPLFAVPVLNPFANPAMAKESRSNSLCDPDMGGDSASQQGKPGDHSSLLPSSSLPAGYLVMMTFW